MPSDLLAFGRNLRLRMLPWKIGCLHREDPATVWQSANQIVGGYLVFGKRI